MTEPRPPRTVLLVHHVATGILTGPEQSLLAIVRHLDRARYVAVVALPGPGPLFDALDGIAGRVEWRGYRSPWRDPLGFARGVRALRGAIVETGADVVHANTYWAGRAAALAARACGVPAVVHVRDVTFAASPAIERAAWVRRADRAVRRALAAATHVVVRPSRWIAVSRFVAATLAGVPFARGPIEVVPHGVEPVPPARRASAGAAFRAQHGIPAAGDVVVAVVGRLNPDKGQHLVLEAVRRLRERGLPVHVALVGGARTAPGLAYEARLRALACDIGLADRVTFTGHVADVWPAFLATDVLVVPSLGADGWGEAAANVIVEGFASGCAVVVSRSGGSAEFVRDGVDGLVVPPGDAGAIAGAVERLARDPALRERLAAGGTRRAAESYSAARAASRIQEIYDEVLATTRRRSPSATRRAAR